MTQRNISLLNSEHFYIGNTNIKAVLRIQISPIANHEISEVISFMKKYHEICLCEWEEEDLFKKACANNPLTNLIAREEGRLVGVLIGGSFGVRGTISHLVVSENNRKQGIGRKLVMQALQGFQYMGIKRIFIAVLNQNKNAYIFWQKIGFNVMLNEKNMEYDL